MTLDKLSGLYCNSCYKVTVFCVKMRWIVFVIEHGYNNTKKSADFRQTILLVIIAVSDHKQPLRPPLVKPFA